MRYDNDDAALCLSNLLAVGFQRFEVDLYWDDGRQVWSFCPATIPTTSNVNEPASSPTSNITRSSDVSGASGASESSILDSTLTSSGIVARQLSLSSNTSTTFSSSSSSPSLSIGASSLGQALPSYSSLPDNPDNSLVSIGP